MSEALRPKPRGAAGDASPERPADTGFTPVGERRQLTIMFCDMENYSGLSAELDPELFQEVVAAYEHEVRTSIEHYGGRVFRIEGDAAFAYFGYPDAGEDDPQQAVRAAIEILEKLRLLEVKHVARVNARIGIAAGIVVVSDERGAEGEAVVRAARLAAEAQPGAILIDDVVRELGMGALECGPATERQLKGLGRTQTYAVTGVNRGNRFDVAAGGKPAPLVGRTKEVAELRKRWELARAGAGQVVLVSGEPGIGKSRIVRALREQAANEDANTLVFQCSKHYEHSAFYPITDYLEQALDFGRDEPDESRLYKLRQYLGKYGRPPEDMRFIAAVLSLPYSGGGEARLTPRREKEETVRALVDLMSAAARATPALIVFEDLHWADPTTLEVLDLLVQRTARLPLLALLTTRPEPKLKTRWPHRLIRTEPAALKPVRPARANPQQDFFVAALELSRLTPAESGELILELTGRKTLPGPLFEQIVDKTDGVPLFVEELTKTVLESGHLHEEDDRYRYGDTPERLSVPATLRGSLMARLVRLGPAKNVAQIGAAIGREFSYELLEHVAGMQKTTLDRALAKLVKSELAFQRGKIPGAVFRFKHALVQEVAYDSLLNSRRPPLHAKIARVIEERWPETRETEPELLAYHYKRANRFEEAVLFWRDAGRLAWKRFALDEAIKHLSEGLSLLDRLPDGVERDRLELELRTAYGPAIVAKRGWADSEVSKVLEPAWERATQFNDRQSYLRILNSLWVHYLSVGKLRMSLQWADELLKAGAEAQDNTLTIVGHRAKAGSYFWLAEFDAALEHGDKVRAMYDGERHGDIVGLINTDPFTGEGIYRAQYLWMLGHVDEAVRVSDEKDAHAESIGHPFDHAFALTLGAQAFGFRSEPEELLRRTEKAERVASEARLHLLSEVLAKISRGVAAIQSGRPAEGARMLDESLTAFSRTGHRVWIWYLRAVQAEGLAMTGELEGALALVEENLAVIENGEDRVYHAEVLRIRGSLLAKQGKLEEAELTLRNAIDVARTQKAKSWELRAAMELARLLADDRHERAKAYVLLAGVYEWFEQLGQGLGTKDLMEAKALLQTLKE